MNLGLFIGRMNPPHYGHLSTIEKSLKENPQTLVLLWTPQNLSPEKNPLSFEEREYLLKKFFHNEVNLAILKLLDNPWQNWAWNLSIQEKIEKNFPQTKKIRFYYGESVDTALNAVREFSHTYGQIIEFQENPRLESFIEIHGQKVPLSATNFRAFLRNWDFENASKFTSEKIFPDIQKMFQEKSL